MKTCVLFATLLLIVSNICDGKETVHKFKHHFQQRSSSPEILKVNGIQVYNNVTKHLLAFLDRSNETAIIFDYFTTNLALINGKTAKTILINSNGSQLIENDTQLIWAGDGEDFEAFYKNLPSIPSPQDSSNPDDQLLAEIKQVTNNFDLPNDDNIVETLRNVAKQLNMNRDIIKVFLSRSGFPLMISHGISRFVRIIGGIGRLFLDVIGGFVSIIPTLIRGVNHMDFNDVMNSANGFEAFVRLLHQFAHHLDFPQTLHRIGSDGRHCFSIIRHFGDDSNDNVDNFFKITDNLLNLRNGNVQLDDFIRHFLNLQGNLRVNIDDIRPHLQTLQNVCDIQNTQFHNGEQLQNLLQIAHGFNNNNLHIDGLDISYIMHLLAEGDFTSALQLLIKIILRFNDMFNPFIAIPRVIGHFVNKGLNNASMDLPTILQNGNIIDLLQHNNEINHVYTTISNSVQQYGDGALNLNHILSASNLLPVINNLNNHVTAVLSVGGNSETNQNPSSTTTAGDLEDSQRSRLHHKRNHHQPQQQRLKQRKRIHAVSKQ